MNKRTFIAVARWIIAIGLFFTAYRYLMGLGQLETVKALPKALLGVGSLLAGVGFVGPELIEWGSFPLRFLFNSIFFPGGSDRPPPNYTLTRVYRDQERYEEAVQQYLGIIRNHPQELLAYIEGIETAFEAGSPEVARKICRMGVRRLKAKGAREHVQRTFKAASGGGTPAQP